MPFVFISVRFQMSSKRAKPGHLLTFCLLISDPQRRHASTIRFEPYCHATCKNVFPCSLKVSTRTPSEKNSSTCLALQRNQSLKFLYIEMKYKYKKTYCWDIWWKDPFAVQQSFFITDMNRFDLLSSSGIVKDEFIISGYIRQSCLQQHFPADWLLDQFWYCHQ